MKRLCVAVALAIVCASAFAQNVGTVDPANRGMNNLADIERGVKVETSKFAAGTTYDGSGYVVDYKCHGFLCNADWAKVNLEAVIVPPVAKYQLTIVINYIDTNARMYDTAAFVGGTTEPLLTTTPDVNECGLGNDECSYAEAVGATVTRAFLEAHAKSGFEVQISGGGVDSTVPVPALYIQGFLAKVPASTPVVASPPVATSVH